MESTDTPMSHHLLPFLHPTGLFRMEVLVLLKPLFQRLTCHQEGIMGGKEPTRFGL